VDAAVLSGRYTREQLLQLAAEADHGFDRLRCPGRASLPRWGPRCRRRTSAG
jgi:hypothetical protein